MKNRTHKIIRHSYFHGFTLLEITISLALGLIVSISVIQLYSMVKKVILRQKSIMHLQETMQASTFFMGQAIRSAGNMGCIKWQDAHIRNIPHEIKLQNIGLTDNQVIRLTSMAALSANPYISKNVLKHIKANTDILWIVNSDIASDKQPNDLMIEADCGEIDLFYWKAKNKWQRYHTDYKTNYKNTKTLRMLNSVLYYISDKNELCSLTLNRNAQSHIEGVHDWKITFDSNNTVNIRFWFRHLDAHLEWEQTWLIR